jgi:uncharacterized protein (DUF2237 family)
MECVLDRSQLCQPAWGFDELASMPIRSVLKASAAQAGEAGRDQMPGDAMMGLWQSPTVLGADLKPCSTDPMTGFFRDGCCRTGPEDLGSHTICAVVTAEFLDHQRSIGNDLTTPRPRYRFPGLAPGDRWCVTAVNWARAYHDRAATPVVLASTHAAVLQVVPLEVLRQHAVDAPDDPSAL